MQDMNAAAPRGDYYGYYPGPGQTPPPARSTGRGLAIAAVSVAGSALVSCWIPFLNVYAFLACPVAVVLAVGALVSAKRKPRLARVLAAVSIGIAILSVVLAWAVNSWAINAWNNSPGSPQSLRESAQRDAGANGMPGVLSGEALEQILAEPVVPSGEAAQLGDFEVRLSEVDRDATDTVQQRTPSAEPQEGNYVLFKFGMRYNGGFLGDTAFKLIPSFVGADGRSYAVADCFSGLNVKGADNPGLYGEDSGNYEICFDLPPEALGEDSRVVLRMQGVAEELYWQP